MQEILDKMRNYTLELWSLMESFGFELIVIMPNRTDEERLQLFQLGFDKPQPKDDEIVILMHYKAENNRTYYQYAPVDAYSFERYQAKTDIIKPIIVQMMVQTLRKVIDEETNGG